MPFSALPLTPLGSTKYLAPTYFPNLGNLLFSHHSHVAWQYTEFREQAWHLCVAKTNRTKICSGINIIKYCIGWFYCHYSGWQGFQSSLFIDKLYVKLWPNIMIDCIFNYLYVNPIFLYMNMIPILCLPHFFPPPLIYLLYQECQT